MATAFNAFDTTPANVVADIKAAILESTDWSNPAGQRVVATTTRGADMVVDLADAAADAQNMQLGVYRTSGLADKVVRYLAVRGSGGATTDPWHVRVSAGKEHLYFDVEGPRPGEPNEVSNGSARESFFLGDIIPYHASDSVPTVALVANTANGNYLGVTINVSRNQGATASWVPAVLCSICPPACYATMSGAGYAPGGVQRYSAADSKTYMFPYVVFEATDGIRGRLARVFFTGFNFLGESSTGIDIIPAAGSRVTYGSDTYILLAPDRTGSSVAHSNSPFGHHYCVGTTDSAIIAIPYS